MPKISQEPITSLCLECANQQIGTSVELGAGVLECLSKLVDLNMDMWRKKTALNIQLAQGCMLSRSPAEAAALMAQQWPTRFQDNAKFLQQSFDMISQTHLALTQSLQQRGAELNQHWDTCLHPAER